MKEEIIISIITVSYNAVKSIERTILSVINQKYANFEYIIIDGGSTDGTIDIIKKYQNNINLWISEPDKGIYDAMNKGIEKARGKWLNFMNAGDTFTNNDVLNNIFNEEKTIPKDIKFLYSNSYISSNNIISHIHNASLEKGEIIHQSCIYQKELHIKHGLYLVTKPIIISDYIFFNSIPKEQTKKISTTISVYDNTGISQGNWCFYQKQCIDYVFGRISLSSVFFNIIKFNLKKLIPKTIKTKLKKLIKQKI